MFGDGIIETLSDLVSDAGNATDEYEYYKALNDILVLCKDERYRISTDDRGRQYYQMASNQMMVDISTYLDNYKNSAHLPGAKLYSISVAHTNSSKRLIMQIPKRGSINAKGMAQIIDSFPKYTVMLILGYDKSRTILTKDDYDRFLKLRESNPEYFMPYIDYILEGLKEIIVIYKSALGE